jgi:transposase
MPEIRRKSDKDFREGAVRCAFDTGRPIAVGAREFDVHEGTLHNWVNRHKAAQRPDTLGESERDELVRLRCEVHELRMQRDVLKKSVVLWVDEAMGRKP